METALVCELAQMRKTEIHMIERESSADAKRIYHAAIYVRLSKEEGALVEGTDKEESDSIINQKELIKAFLADKPDIEICAECVDDGYSGTDFERPGFEHMLDKVRNREIDCIVVKDLSRFGRNYVETGYYLEKIFPYLGVRFVAVNDGYDTLKDMNGDDMVLSLKNLVNDLYARDISQKTSSSLNTKRKNGEYIGAVPPYGYLKSPEDKHKLVMDPSAASVVRDIFRWRAEGVGIVQIVRKLNEEGVPSPALYYYLKGCAGKEPSETGRLWKAPVIRRMLGNPVYAGHMAQGKTKKSLCEGIAKMDIPRNEWIIVKNTHLPIVDQKTFDRVQALMEERCRQSLTIRGKYETEENVFKGLLVCSDCGRKMVRHKSVSTKGAARYAFVCDIYEQNRGRRGCTKKYIREQDIQEAVFWSLRLQTEVALNKERRQPQQKQDDCCGQGKGAEDRIRNLRQKIKRNMSLRCMLFESFCNGVLTKADYLSMKAEYDEKARELEGELAECDFPEKEVVSPNGCRKEKAVTRKMALELIRYIRISGYNELELVWNFQDGFACMAKTSVCDQERRRGAV